MTRFRPGITKWFVLPFGVFGCGANEAVDVLGRTEESVIYGSDDRVEALECSTPEVRDLATQSVGAFFFQSQVKVNAASNRIDLSTRTLKEQLGLCDQVRFGGQPTGAQCSGVVISDDLVVTAGHCLGHDAKAATATCNDLLFVFGYLLDSHGRKLPITGEQLYACQSVIARAYDPDDASVGDFAVVRLDRQLGPNHPSIPIADTVEVGSPIIAIGNGAGLPTKVASNATVVELLQERPYLRAMTDSFAGGSGSAIATEGMELAAIQSRGQADWIWDKAQQCYTESTLGTGFESHQLARFVVDRLCEQAPCAAQQLCYGSEFEDGRKSCGGTPHMPATCGDGTCSPDERRNCPMDCAEVARVPWGWACQAHSYGTGDGCQCSCGVVDSDCMDPSQEVVDCGGLETCGSCVGIERKPHPGAGACGIARVTDFGGGTWLVWGFFAQLVLGIRRIAQRGIAPRWFHPKPTRVVAA